MSEIEPITREESLLNAIAESSDSGIEPITRQELYLSAIAGESELPSGMEPITREELYYQKILDNGGTGGGGEATGTKYITINSNGTTSSNVKAYATAEITTNVPNSYSASDEGKVVSNGALASQTSTTVTANGTVDTTLNNEVVVNVPTGITPSGTKSISISANGTTTEDVTSYASAQIAVNVPNSYSASDEGKVVDNGALVSQTSQSITANGTYDTTTNDEVVVNVASAITYTPVDDWTSGITSNNLFNAFRAAVGTQEVMGYENNIDPSDTTYRRLVYGASGVSGLQQWRCYKENESTISTGAGSATFKFKPNVSFTLYKGWTNS